MRILPVISNIFLQRGDFKNNRYNGYSQYGTVLRSPLTDTFTGLKTIIPIKTKNEFREHALKRVYHCMYCGVPMRYDENMFLEWKRSNLFYKPIGEFVKTFGKYKDSLHTSEREIFDFIEFISRKSPTAKLDTVIKIMSVKANKELLKIQEPIFDAIAVEACKLPEENKRAVFDLIARSKYRMLRIPHKEEFSGKELRYKIENLSKTLSSEKLAERVNKLAELLTIPAIYKQTEPVTDIIIIRILRTIKPISRINKKTKVNHNYSAKRLNKMIIEAIKAEVKEHKRKDIYNLCIEAEDKLDGKPVIGKFTNKSLIHDLKEAMDGIGEKNRVRRTLLRLANSLPTSKNSVFAFITKHDQASPAKIASDLFTPSELTLEHMQPSSLKGEDILPNWAWACKRCNNTRSNNDMAVFYRNFDPQNAQNYWNEIIEDANKGYFDFWDIVSMLKVFKDQSGKKIQSKHLKFRRPYCEN